MARSLTRPAERVQSTQTVGRSGSGVSTVTCSEIGPLAPGPSATCGLDWRRWECRGWVDVMQSCKAAKEKRSHTHVALPRSRPRPRLPPPPPPPRCTAGPTRGGGLQVQTVKRRWMPKSSMSQRLRTWVRWRLSVTFGPFTGSKTDFMGSKLVREAIQTNHVAFWGLCFYV